MAFNADFLTCDNEGSSNKIKRWVYRDTAAYATVAAAGYIPVGYGLKVADVVIYVQTSDLTDAATFTAGTTGFVKVASATAGVTLTSGTATGGT